MIYSNIIRKRIRFQVEHIFGKLIVLVVVLFKFTDTIFAGEIRLKEEISQDEEEYFLSMIKIFSTWSMLIFCLHERACRFLLCASVDVAALAWPKIA